MAKKRKTTRRLPSIGLLGLLLAPWLANAAVADSAEGGFTIKLTLTIQGSPEKVYQSLVSHIGEWWDPRHTFSGDAHNLSIEEKPMGCFCEKLPGAGGVRHMEVVNFAPGKTLVMIGALGPMQSLATTGSMTIRLAPAGDGKPSGNTKLDVTYAVAGYIPGGLNTFAATADGVLVGQFTRLKSYVEHGDPVSK